MANTDENKMEKFQIEQSIMISVKQEFGILPEWFYNSAMILYAVTMTIYRLISTVATSFFNKQKWKGNRNYGW